jgi:RNA polymerase sigma-70 factor (ECF subfamily)
VIARAPTRNTVGMQATDAGLAVAREEPSPLARARRFEALATEHYQFVWRSLRRLGVAEHAVDDAAQRVFEVVAAKLSRIDLGCERSFLFQTAVRTAMAVRRTYAQRREAMLGEELDELVDPRPLPDDTVEERQRRAYLDRLLETLPMELRSVFVLFEIEGLSTPEIATMLDIPVGTTASRLRRARDIFREQAARLRKQIERRVKR